MLTVEQIKKYKDGERQNARVNFTIRKKEKEEFRKLAKREGVSMSELIRMLIYECINLDKKEKK